MGNVPLLFVFVCLGLIMVYRFCDVLESSIFKKRPERFIDNLRISLKVIRGRRGCEIDEDKIEQDRPGVDIVEPEWLLHCSLYFYVFKRLNVRKCC